MLSVSMLNIWQICIRTVLAASVSMWLSGCMGAPLAQQLLASAVMHGTDSIIDDAYEAKQREAIHHHTLADAAPDPYWSSFVTAGFERITPIAEPLPAAPPEMHAQAQETRQLTPSLQAETPLQTNTSVRTAPLVRVEVWNLLIGDEKRLVLERAYALGNAELPPKRDWEQVNVATGAIAGDELQPVTFLVPPQLGKLRSGQLAIVELGQAGDLSIARYPAH